MASHLPKLASPPPPEPLPLAPVGQPHAGTSQQRLLLGEQGLEPPPEPPQEAPKLLPPIPLAKRCRGS